MTVQRQAGKTTLDLANDIQNCLMGKRREVWYTAQTGQHASAKWKQMAELFKESPLKRLGKARFSNGTQSLTFLNGSAIRPHPPTEDSLHSKQSDKNTIDEAWYFSAAKAEALLGAIVPTTTTRRKLTGQRPQLWILSTEGTTESEYLNELLDSLRLDMPADTAFFDFGISPDLELPNLARDDEVSTFLDAVYAVHPGAGFLLEREDLDSWLDSLGLSEFCRAYGNRRTGATERVISEADWRAGSTAVKLAGQVCFAAAVGMDDSDTTITATGIVDGFKITEVIDHHEGSSWALPRMKELSAKHGAPFAIDGYGPSADLADRAERAGIPLVPIKTVNVAAACQAVYSGLVRRGEPAIWRYRPDPALDAAADIAVKRSVGDGAWVWGRRASNGSTSALEAATLGTYGIDHMPEVAGIQIF
ncbi:hypothetical protein [Arthrobacter sp. HLT1-21]